MKQERWFEFGFLGQSFLFNATLLLKRRKMKHSSLFLLLCVSFLSACAPVDRGNFGPFERIWGKKGHGYQVKDDARAKAAFKKVEYFELRPGDCGSTGWNQCGADQESSVLIEKNGDQRTGDEYWYGWSIYFPVDFPNVDPTGTEIGTFMQYTHRTISPTWIFTNSPRGYYLVENIPPSYEEYQLIDKKDLRCRWHKIEVHARWSRDRTGFFKVWVNGVQKVDFQGQTLESRTNVHNVYFLYGIKRNRVSRYQKRFNKEIPTQRVYFANVKRGDSRSDLRAQPGL